ncbi:MAG: hypothetical protein ABR562_01025 [Thermoplasmatota archaeon]
MPTMIRVAPLFFASLACAAFLATPAAADSIAITGLPATVQANGTQAALPFSVDVSVDMGNCAGGTSQPITITLSAEVTNVAGSNVVASVNPPTFTMDIGPTDTVRSAFTDPQPATLIVDAKNLASPLDANVAVKATASNPSCYVAVHGAGPFDAANGNTTISFKPATANTDNQSTEEPVPGPGLPLVAFAVVAVAVVLRRR